MPSLRLLLFLTTTQNKFLYLIDIVIIRLWYVYSHPSPPFLFLEKKKMEKSYPIPFTQNYLLKPYLHSFR